LLKQSGDLTIVPLVRDMQICALGALSARLPHAYSEIIRDAEVRAVAFMERAKSAFEWLEHGKTAVEIGLWVIAALGGGRVVRAWLVQHTSIAMEWISPLWLMSSAIFLWLLLRFAPRINSHKQPTQTDSIQSASIANPATVTTQSVDEFYRTYDNVLLRECEDNVRTLANAFPAGNDRERFFLRFIASGMIGYVFDVVWYTIYKSQLDALLQLNSTSLTARV
jgi:hypothetical protein